MNKSKDEICAAVRWTTTRRTKCAAVGKLQNALALRAALT